MTTPHYLFALLALTSLLPAQIKKVIPPRYAKYEANSRWSYPFAKPTTEVQILTDGKVLSNGAGFISAFAFRADKPLVATTGYSKKYQVTFYPTTVSPAAMTKNPVTNIGTAKGTVVFNKTLSIPNVAAQKTCPAKTFALRIPVLPNYVFDGSKTNLLISMKTMDTGAVTKWYPDTVSFGHPTAKAEYTVVGLGCSVSAGYMKIAFSSSSYLGGTLGITPKRATSSVPVGTWKQALLGIDTSVTRPGFPADMSAAGMPACNLFINPQHVWYLPELASGDYTPLNVALPNAPGLIDVPLYFQALGAGAGPGLSGSVLTDAWQLMLVPLKVPTSIVETIYQSSSGSWYGVFGTLDMYPVIEYDGVFK